MNISRVRSLQISQTLLFEMKECSKQNVLEKLITKIINENNNKNDLSKNVKIVIKIKCPRNFDENIFLGGKNLLFRFWEKY